MLAAAFKLCPAPTNEQLVAIANPSNLGNPDPNPNPNPTLTLTLPPIWPTLTLTPTLTLP